MLKDFLISLSLANLCFLHVWEQLLTRDEMNYFMVYPPSSAAYFAVLLNVLLLAGVFWLIRSLARLFLSEQWRGFASVLVFLVVGNFVLYSMQRTASIVTLSHSRFVPVRPMLAFVAVLVAIWWRKWVERGVEVVVLILSSFIVITFGQTLVSLVNHEATTREYAARTTTPLTLRHETSPRVVWLLFDEFDEQLAFAERPAGLHLPEFDRFRMQAIYSTQASSVAGETLLTMPALVIGRRVSKAQAVDLSSLHLTLADSGETVDWASQPNIFAKAQAVGVNTAVVGFYHPYCRVFRDSLNLCSSWDSHRAWTYLPVFTVFENMITQISMVLGDVAVINRFFLPSRFVGRFENIGVKRRQLDLDRYLGMVEEAKKMVANRGLGLVLVHLPVPHGPFIYDRVAARFNLGGKRTYLDNLALADCTLGMLRRAMEDAGVWEDSVVGHV